MRVSKHHYALAMAKQGAKVYFVEPPYLNNKAEIQLTNIHEDDNLFVVSYRPIARGKRYLPRFAYDFFQKRQSRIILRAIGKPDILLSFYPFMFQNLKWFKASKSIFFAVDLVGKELPGEVLSADICFGVSRTICNQLSTGGRHIHMINHGLNDAFSKYATRQLNLLNSSSRIQSSKTLTIGYFGNLMIGALDRNVMKQVIVQHKDMHFVFWGQFERNQDNMVAYESKEVWQFIEFLRASPNVHLKGPKESHELVKEIEMVDVFWLCYNNKYDSQVDGSNSHKILEYLATGKPVISSHISAYQNSSLLYMLQEEDNSKFSSYFEDSLHKIQLEGNDLAQKRIEFALSNTYDQHLNTITRLITQLV